MQPEIALTTSTPCVSRSISAFREIWPRFVMFEGFLHEEGPIVTRMQLRQTDQKLTNSPGRALAKGGETAQPYAYPRCDVPMPGSRQGCWTDHP